MRVGLALSGGGIKGAAHIGGLKALQENYIPIDIILGSSSGSIVASLASMGYTPDEILKLFHFFAKMIFKNTPTYTYPSGKKSLSIQVGGFLSGDNISYAINESAKYKRIKRMQDLKMKIVIPSVDIDESKKYVFTNTEEEGSYYIKNAPIDTAVRASCSYPGVFAPCIYKGHKFIDGGVLDNIPVDEVKKAGADKIIAVKFGLNRRAKTKGIVGVTTKAIDILFDRRSLEETKNANIILNIDTKNTMIFDIKKIDLCYEAGYKKTIEKIEEIKKMIEEKE